MKKGMVGRAPNNHQSLYLLEVWSGPVRTEMDRKYGMRKTGYLLSAILIGSTLSVVMIPDFPVSQAMGKTDPNGVIRILCVGESYYPETPLPLLVRSDPKIQYDPLPANLGEGTFTWGGPAALKRFVRIYMPRRYEDFINSYDLIILSDYPAIFLEPEHYRWFEKSVREEGAGLAKYEVNFAMGGASYPMDPWRSSPVYPAFPTELPDKNLPCLGPGGSGRPPDGVEVEKNNPLVDLPGVERFDLFGTGGFGMENPKQATRTIAWFKIVGIDAIVIWEYGKGRSASTIPGLDWMDNTAVRQWDFYPDFFLNQFYWLCGEEIPEDVYLVNNIRHGLRNLQIKTQLILSVVDFIETFGASGMELGKDLARMDDLRSGVRESYLVQEYATAAKKIEDCLSLMEDMEHRAVELKDRALLWIYVIEWLVVSGVAMICGFSIYTLMIKRRMYREVSVTRLSSRS